MASRLLRTALHHACSRAKAMALAATLTPQGHTWEPHCHYDTHCLYVGQAQIAHTSIHIQTQAD